MQHGRGVTHEYDPSIVFHSHSSDLPHLNDWISELIALSDKSLPIQANPTTEQLVQALQRYDSMFRELLRQTSIFSEPITKLLAKVWGGNLKLLDFMIRSYHRYVKHTTHLQEQAQHLLTERQGQMVAAKMKEEEFEMEKLVLRARIRNLESEVEALTLAERSKEKEIMRLRTTVSAYMRSEELNDGVWKLMNSTDPVTLTKDQEIPEQIDTKFCRKDSLDAASSQLRQLSKLDVSMDAVIGGVLKEEDRQRMIVVDIMKLMKRNEAVFGALRRVKGVWQSGTIEATKYEEKGCQVDERDAYGAVVDIIRSPRDIPNKNPPLPPADMSVKGADVPYQLRKLMKTFPHILRIPPAAWVCQNIMTIYFDKVRADEELKAKGLSTMSLAVHMHEYYKRSLGTEAAADAQVAQLLTACDYYREKVSRVTLFSAQIGLLDKNELPTLDVRDTDYLLSIIRQLLKTGEMVAIDHSAAHGRLTPGLNQKGRGTIADPHHGRGQDLAQQSYLARRASRELIHPPAHGTDKKTALFNLWDTMYSTVGSEISKTNACKVVQQVLGRWLPDGGQDYVMKVKYLNPVDKSGKMIDIDEFIETMLEPWKDIRINWVEHARYLFREHCTIHKVLSEAQFATDDGGMERDSILVEVLRVVSMESTRRSMRYFQTRSPDSKPSGAVRKAPKLEKSMAIEKEPVCEMMNRRVFASVVKIIDPNIPPEKVDKMFDDACAWSHEACLHVLSQMWLRCTYENKADEETLDEMSDDEFFEDANGILHKVHHHHGRYYYVNLKNKRTQWTRPYHERTFFCTEIEIDAFIAIVLKHDILANCPFVELFHVAPPDLWPNADLFLKQAQDAKLKAKRIADQLHQQQQQAVLQAQLAQQAAEARAKSPALGTDSPSQSSPNTARADDPNRRQTIRQGGSRPSMLQKPAESGDGDKLDSSRPGSSQSNKAPNSARGTSSTPKGSSRPGSRPQSGDASGKASPSQSRPTSSKSRPSSRPSSAKGGKSASPRSSSAHAESENGEMTDDGGETHSDSDNGGGTTSRPTSSRGSRLSGLPEEADEDALSTT